MDEVQQLVLPYTTAEQLEKHAPEVAQKLKDEALTEATPEQLQQAAAKLPDAQKAQTVEALSDDLSDEEFERIAARRAAKRKPPAAPPTS